MSETEKKFPSNLLTEKCFPPKKRSPPPFKLNGCSLTTFVYIFKTNISAHYTDLEVERNSGWYLVLQQFIAMFIKRAKHSMRNKIVTISQLIVPLFFTLMALIVIQTFPGPQDSPALELNISKFGSSNIVYSEQKDTVAIKDLGEFYSEQFIHSGSNIQLVNHNKAYKDNPNITSYLIQKGSENLGIYNLYYMVAAEFKKKNGKNDQDIKATAYFNDQSYHSIPISYAALSNAVLKYVTNNSAYSISTTNHPLPRTTQQRVKDQVTQGSTGFTLAFNVVFGMSFLASSFVVFLISERATKAKHIQFVSGVHPFNFWASTFCWDIINYLIPSMCILIAFWGFNIKPYVGYHAGHMILLFFFYGWAMLPFMYLMSFIFTVPSSGYVWLTMFNILAGK